MVSIRALPTSDPKDIDLYEAIDVIEAAVPARPDVKVFNVSFGPRGGMQDDVISRFTYTLDRLALAHKVTFCVAVGNDGDAGPDLDRIQVPADLVNGLGVAAHTRRRNVNVHAPYSCTGPGRECGKLKPDIAAFGGCELEPIHLVSLTPGLKILSFGTSFASPIAAALAAQAADGFERSTALLARALLVHTAEHPNGKPDHLLGHGIIRSTMAEIVRTGDNQVTIVFQGDIAPTKSMRLPIMLPPGLTTKGKVGITWTVAALPTVNSNHASDYTSACIEDTFYPNKRVFTFSVKDKLGKQKSKKIHLDDAASEAAQLVAHGWKRSELPTSESGNRYPKEQDRRTLDYKWEPIVRRHISKMADSLNEPFLILHAIPRNGATARLDYAAVVTISAPQFIGDLHDAVLRRFAALQPIRLRSEAEIRVQI
ncbi:MAG: S8 family serine peptidase [Limisphaerales bacterium]